MQLSRNRVGAVALAAVALTILGGAAAAAGDEPDPKNDGPYTVTWTDDDGAHREVIVRRNGHLVAVGGKAPVWEAPQELEDVSVVVTADKLRTGR